MSCLMYLARMLRRASLPCGVASSKATNSSTLEECAQASTNAGIQLATIATATVTPSSVRLIPFSFV